MEKRLSRSRMWSMSPDSVRKGVCWGQEDMTKQARARLVNLSCKRQRDTVGLSSRKSFV